MIFTAHQLQEKCQEQNQPLYKTFTALTKAFDSVSCEALWLVQANIGCHEKYIQILRLLHENMYATVLSGSGETEPFGVDNTLQLFYISQENSFPMYRPNGQLFSINWFRAKGQSTTVSTMQREYANDNAIVTLSEEDLQCIHQGIQMAWSGHQYKKDHDTPAKTEQ